MPKAGGKLVGELQVQRATQQFASIAANVRQLKPDAIYIASFGTQVNQIIKQLRDNGITQQLVSYSAMSTPSIAELPEAKGSWYTTQSADFTASALGQRVAKEYKELSGKDANAYVANYYNAIMVFGILAQQLEKAGKPITGTTCLNSAARARTFELVGGKMAFQQNGTVAAPVQIRKSTARARASASSSRRAAAQLVMVFLQLFVNGLQLGAIYALTAVGFSLIFGSTKIFHVAHGSAFAISGYIYWWLASKLGVPWPIATLAAVIAAAVFGLLMERWIYRPIQRHEASFFTVFIAAFGVQLIIQNLIGTVAGRGMETVNTPLSRSVEVMDGLFIAPIAAISIVVAIVVFYALNYFLTRTHVGIAMRALSENPDLVRVFGLDPGRVAQWAFMIGSAVVVPGAIFTAMTAGLNPAIGTHVMLVSLAATIVGGIGSVRGAAAGGMLLGLAENLAYWKLDPQWSEAVTFIVLFAFIIFRPSGFFGSPTIAK